MILKVLGCDGAYPQANGACSGYLLEQGEQRVILDCGTGVLERLLRAAPPQHWGALVLSHLHGDHMSDALVLRHVLQAQKAQGLLPAAHKMDLYLPASPAREHALLADEDYFNVHVITDGMQAQIGCMRFTFLRMNHPLEAYGMRIQCEDRILAYTGDTNVCDNLLPLARGAHLLVADSGVLHKNWSAAAPHLSPQKCGELARDAEVGQLLLTHGGPGCNPQARLQEAQAIFPCTAVAEAGMALQV